MSSFLEDKIRDASQKYYSGEDSGMTDEEFDKYMNKYEEEEPDGELLHKVGHGYDVNKDSTPGEKVKHRYGKAGSLDKAYNYSEFHDFVKSGMEQHASLKLDGLSVVLYYECGSLVQALTRGDGETGIDITEKVKYIMHDEYMGGLKDKIFTGAARGEIIMTNEAFNMYKLRHPEAKNARNTAAGLINSKDISIELQYLIVVVYTVVGIEKSLYLSTDNINRRTIQMWLQNNFKHVVPFDYVWIDEDTYLEELTSLKKRWDSYGFPSDGIVLSDMHVGQMFKSGVGYEILYISQAFKFKSETAETKVIRIDWQLTKNCRLMPTVVCDPIQLAGTTVQRATGYNAYYILENKIGKGSVVEIEKHGEIIPNINKVVTSSTDCILPKHCPRCNSTLIWRGVDLTCANETCVNAIEQDTLMWVKHLVPTDGLGDTLILKFLYQIYSKDISIETIMNSHLFFAGERAGSQLRQFRKMLDRLIRVDRFKLKDALEALNIPRLGDITSAKLAEHHEIVYDALKHCDDPDAVYEIIRTCLGEADSRAISDNLHKFRRLYLIRERIIVDDVKEESVEQKGIKVAVTGKLSVSRKQFESELSSFGFELGDVCKDTKVLITDDPNSSSSKNRKAEKFGVTKMSELEFRSKYFQ